MVFWEKVGDGKGGNSIHDGFELTVQLCMTLRKGSDCFIEALNGGLTGVMLRHIVVARIGRERQVGPLCYEFRTSIANTLSYLV